MAISSAERLSIEKLVVLMFDAAPGSGYLAQIVSLYEALGHDLEGVANTLDDIPVFQSLHPNFQTAAEFAADFLAPLGLQGDAIATGFVVEKFNAGMSKGQIMFLGLQALDTLPPNAAPQYLAAHATLENQAAVSEYYSVIKGISNTDVGILQTVLDGITADAATVASALAEIDAGTRGVQGITVIGTSSQDTVVGTNAADLVNGLFGGGGADATLTAGDAIDGGAGSDRLNLVATGTAPSAAAIIKNVETINIQDTVGATFNALLVESDPAVNFTSTLAGQTSRVINAALGSVIGLAGKGDLVVDYSDTSGTADTANIALHGVGASATDLSTVNVADGDTIEAVTIAATGANFVKLLAGTAAATVTITGNGTNAFTMGSLKSVSTIDASASTGTNTFNLGGTAGNGDVIKGGSGEDTATFSATSAPGTITFNNVETVRATIDADVALNLGSSSGLKTLTLAGGSGSVQVNNATSELTTIHYQFPEADDEVNDFSIAYKNGQAGNLIFDLEALAGNGSLDELSFTRVKSLLVSASGVATSLVTGDVHIDDTTESLGFHVEETRQLSMYQYVTTGGTNSALKALDFDAGAHSILSFGTYSGGGLDVAGARDLAVKMSVASAGSASVQQVAAASFADVILDVGQDAKGILKGLHASDGGFGNITMSVDSGGSGIVRADAEGASADIGDFHLEMASGGDVGVTLLSHGGDIGNVVTDIGTNAGAAMNIHASGGSGDDGLYAKGGNIADLDFRVVGGIGHFVITADAMYDAGSGAGGNVGDVYLVVSGSGAQADLTIDSDGGSQGDFTIDLGQSATGMIRVSAYDSFDSSGGSGNVGDIAISLSEKSQLDARWDVSGSIGDYTLVEGDHASARTACYASGGDIGTVTLSMGNDALLHAWFSAAAVALDDATVVVGEDSHVTVGLQTSVGGTIGDIDVAAGAGSHVSVYSSGGANSTAGDVKISGGASGDLAYVDATGGSIEGIDLRGWMGAYLIEAYNTQKGTTILTSSGGGIVQGTQGNDFIVGGDGNDTMMASGGLDVIDGGAGNDFLTGGAGIDVLTGGAGADIFSFTSSDDVLVVAVPMASLAVTDVVADFETALDQLEFPVAGTGVNFAGNAAPATSLKDLLAVADEKLDGTVQYYFGAVGGDGYLVHSADGSSADALIQLPGVTSLAWGDIVSPAV